MSKLFKYRLVYARLNQYSDEAVVVGIVYQDETRARFKAVEQKIIFDALSVLVSREWIEQLFFSVRIQKEILKNANFDVSQLDPATSVLKLGKLCTAQPVNCDKFLGDLLKTCSVLYGKYRVLCKAEYETTNQKELEVEIKSAIIKIDPFKGKNIIASRKVDLDKRKIEIPFCGERLIGAPISMQRPDPHDALSNAEHWLVRLRYAAKALEKEGLHRCPHLYLFSPYDSDASRGTKIRNTASEIREIGDSINVAVSTGETVVDLAKNIYRDELAGVS